VNLVAKEPYSAYQLIFTTMADVNKPEEKKEEQTPAQAPGATPKA